MQVVFTPPASGKNSSFGGFMSFSKSLREIAWSVAYKYLGSWYIWGGDDPYGFDCSGFVIEILKSVGKLPAEGDWTAQQLYYLFEDRKTTIPKMGTLVFFCKKNDPSRKIVHVEMCLNDKLSIGAMGGGSFIRTAEDASKHNAFIKIRPFEDKGRLEVKAFIDIFDEV